jgi:hypothetical protein
MVLDDKVREIGRRARERLEIEKSKRKEIVRLQDQHGPASDVASAPKKLFAGSGPPTQVATATATGSNRGPSQFSRAVKQSGQTRKSKPPSRKRKRKAAAATTASSVQKITDANHVIDPRSPSIENLRFQDLPVADKSNLVRIHGLPTGTKSDHIRKFLCGLHPEQIFILPSFNRHIPGFDAPRIEESSTLPKRKKKSGDNMKNVNRLPSTFRVLVKFGNVASAETSIARSGEMIQVPLEAQDGDDDDNGRQAKRKVSAAISLSHLSQRVGAYLQNHMSIECPRGRILADVLNEAEKDLPSIINQITWIKAEQRLRLGIKIKYLGGTNVNGKYPSILSKDLLQIFPPVNSRERDHLVIVHNNLLDIYEQLEDTCSPFKFNAAVTDPSFMSNNSTDALMHNVARWLFDQMERIQTCIRVHIM